MANSTNVQLLENGHRNLVIKATGILDTSNVTNLKIVDIADASYVPRATSLRVDHIYYSISDQLECQLYWEATTSDIIMPLAGRGKLSFWDIGGIQNPKSTGWTGSILLTTTGWASGIQVYSLVLDLVKNGVG